MTETTTVATKAKTTKHAASSIGMPDYGMPKFQIPKFDLPNMEMPQALREMAEKGVEHTRDAYAKAKVASEDAADLFENIYEASAKGVTDYNLKLFEIARINTRAALDYAGKPQSPSPERACRALCSARTRSRIACAFARSSTR